MPPPKSKVEITLNLGIVILLVTIVTALVTKYLLLSRQSNLGASSVTLASPSAAASCLQLTQISSVSSTTQAVIVDTRERTAFRSRWLKGAINIPALELEARALDEVPQNTPIILVGNFLPQSQNLLNRLGWKDVFILCGDIRDWEKSDSLLVESMNAT